MTGYINDVEKIRELEHHYVSMIDDKHKLDLLKFMASALVDIRNDLKILRHKCI